MAPRTEKKTITVAPRPVAKVTFTVRHKASGAPAKDVQLRGDSMTGAAAERVWPNKGKTNALGKAQVNFWVGDVRVLAREPDGYAAAGMRRWENDNQWAVIHEGPFTAGTHSVDVALVCIAAHANVTVTETVTQEPLPGATVSVGTFSGQTNAQGKVKTELLAAGILHTLSITRNGHGPASGTEEGPVTHDVDFRNLTVVKDQDVALEMKNLWPRISNGKFEVDSLGFPEWFNMKFAPRYPATHNTLLYPGPTKTNPKGTPAPTFPFREKNFNAAQFRTVLDALPKWWGLSLSVEEFVAIFLIIANETGGTFAPAIEKGSLQYVYQYNHTGGGLGNRLAGNQLKERGILIDPTDVQTWNTTTWPGLARPVPTEVQLKECDFWKYRGRGFIQTTSYPNYTAPAIVKVFTAAGLAGPELMTSDELDSAVRDNESVYYPLLKAELRRRSGPFSGTNGQQWRAFGETIAGTTNKYYLDLYEWRCKELYAALSQAAREGKLQLLP